MRDTYFSKQDIQNILDDIEPKEKWDNGRAKRRIVRYKQNKDDLHSAHSYFVEEVELDDTQLKHNKNYSTGKKMAPYTKKGFYPKYERENKGYRKSGFPNTSKRHKEMIKNANRSMKKTVRQQWKKELRKELESE